MISEEEKKRRSLAAKLSYQGEKGALLRKSRSEDRKKMWKDPAYAEMIKEKNSKTVKELQLNKEYKVKTLAAHRTPEHRKRMSENARKQWKDPKIRKKMILSLEKDYPKRKQRSLELLNDQKYMDSYRKGVNAKPNNGEKKILEFLKEINQDWKYTGDFSFFVGGKNPDFWNGQNKLIEFLGCYFHKCKCRNGTGDEKLSERIELFKNLGYNCLIVWEHELKDKEKLRSKLHSFI